jgi:hypothetical protein
MYEVLNNETPELLTFSNNIVISCVSMKGICYKYTGSNDLKRKTKYVMLICNKYCNELAGFYIQDGSLFITLQSSIHNC